MRIDIVTRLHSASANADFLRPIENLCHDAAHEIQRLRAERDVAENSLLDVGRKRVEELGDRAKLVIKNDTLTAERDEARREICRILTAHHGDPKTIAKMRGWDCFDKEATP